MFIHQCLTICSKKYKNIYENCRGMDGEFQFFAYVVKEYKISFWEVKKVKLYREPYSTHPQSQSLAGDPWDARHCGWWAEKRLVW